MKKLVLITVLFFTLKAFAQNGNVAIDASLTETPVTVKTLSGVVAGSLVVPKNKVDKIPVVLIIGDAGPTDRDGNNARTGVSANTYKLLANELGKKGIATLRFDKRFTGASTTTTKESQLHIEDYSDDVVSLLNMLLEGQKFSKIIFFGHGEGALVSMIAAYEQPVNGFISVEGAADKAEKILTNEMKSRPQFLADKFKTIMDSLRKGKVTENVDPSLYFIARPSVQQFLMSWCRYDPIKDIKKTKPVTLIIQGTTDLTVAADNGDRLKKARSEATLLSIKNMNHVLKEAPADPEKNMATYSDPDLPLKPELVTGVVDFVTRLK